MRVLCVLGTRPEAIKLAPVISALARRGREHSDTEVALCVTAQHADLVDDGLVSFGLVPDHDLGLMRVDQQPSQVAAGVLERLPAVLAAESPDWVVVQGDTTSAMAAALAAFYGSIPVAHVEAGLRTTNKWRPFPEEVNRRVVSAIADLHFAPTERARDALLAEGIDGDRVVVTGNTVVDALYSVLDREGAPHVTFSDDASTTRRVVVTMHRRESHGATLEALCRGVQAIAERCVGVEMVLPVHPNPNVAATVHRVLDGTTGVRLVDPLDYVSMVHLLDHADLVLTDSGGVQEEACALGIRTLVLREETERMEGVDAGLLEVVGTDATRLVDRATALLAVATPARAPRGASPFGDGRAADRIVTALVERGRGA